MRRPPWNGLNCPYRASKAAPGWQGQRMGQESQWGEARRSWIWCIPSGPACLAEPSSGVNISDDPTQ